MGRQSEVDHSNTTSADIAWMSFPAGPVRASTMA
jgi:hypothetical protein